ncbi:MAG: hypothetical protein GEU94_07755 [Micromonosporaceae bacterium]|nr:hypothetical protein [Micromonosporaceae bacterium]
MVLVVIAVQAVFLSLFAWPAVTAEPRDLPIVIAGPEPVAKAVGDKLDEAEPGAFDVTYVDDADAAEQAVRDQQAYGGFVVAPSPQGPPQLEVRVASAASPAVAQMLTQIGQSAGRAAGQTAPVTVVDVVAAVAADPDDPRGAALTAGILPLVMTSIVAGLLLVVVLRSRVARFVGLLLYGASAGLAAAAVLQHGFEALPGDYVSNAAAIGLTALAMAGTVAGLGAVLGIAGAGLGGAVMFLLGNPLSGLASAPEMLPQPWGEVGQWLPPGAGGALLRSVAFFDGAAAAYPMWILAGWAAVGLLTLVGRAGGPPHAGKKPAANRQDVAAEGAEPTPVS